MDNHQDKKVFNYTYSAKQQEEINRIRSKYIAPKEDKMEQLRRLDASASRKASMNALIVGVIGALIMGSGMSLVMTDLYEIVGLSQTIGMVIGIIVGIVGLMFVSLAYPLYNRTLLKEREKIAPEIIRLSDELMKS